MYCDSKHPRIYANQEISIHTIKKATMKLIIFLEIKERYWHGSTIEGINT
jgi:hypothetical protein